MSLSGWVSLACRDRPVSSLPHAPFDELLDHDVDPLPFDDLVQDGPLEPAPHVGDPLEGLGFPFSTSHGRAHDGLLQEHQQLRRPWEKDARAPSEPEDAHAVQERANHHVTEPEELSGEHELRFSVPARALS